MIEEIKSILEFKLIDLSKLTISVFDLGLIVAIFFFTWLIIKMIKMFVHRSIAKREWMDLSSLYALEKLVAYFGYTIALLVALDTVGINLTIILAGSAALLVGFGLGIQHIFNDFVSGLILLFGGTVKVNNIVEFNQTVGKVIEIDFRTSKIRTRDGIVIIVPNSKLVSDNVINWSVMDGLTRFHVDVGVAYGSDVELVQEILIQAANNHPAVEKERPIKVQFKNFGNSSLEFQVHFWALNSWEVEFIKSEIRFEINKLFQKHNITIPFPQMDVHFNKLPDQSDVA